MIVKNEEKVLPRILKPMKEIVDKILICDTGSTDRTKEIIREFTAAAHEKGIKNLEFYTEEIQKSSLEVYQGKVQDRQLCKTQACYVSGD